MDRPTDCDGPEEGSTSPPDADKIPSSDTGTAAGTAPLKGDPPRFAPIGGGGRCDRCGWRSFRRTQTGLWRHLPCEPRGYHVAQAAAMARHLAAGEPLRTPTATATLPPGCQVTLPAGVLAVETLGAYRRRTGTGVAVEARVALAVALVEEARRRVLAERLAGVYRFLEAGATVEQAAARLDRILAEARHRLPSTDRLDAAA
jgi:hypothetical protein